MTRLPWIALLLLVPFVAATGPRVESQGYVGGTGDFTALCDVAATGQNVGGACFVVLPGEERVTVFISDLHGAGTGGLARFRDAGAAPLADVSFCRGVSLAIPEGAATLSVFVDEAFGLFDCGVNPFTGTVGVGTGGSVTAYFR